MGYTQVKSLNEMSVAELLELANETRSEGILRQLAKSEKVIIRGEVALNSNTPEDVIRYFAENDTKYIKQIILKRFKENKKMPSKEMLEILKILAEDEAEEIRESALVLMSTHYNM